MKEVTGGAQNVQHKLASHWRVESWGVELISSRRRGTRRRCSPSMTGVVFGGLRSGGSLVIRFPILASRTLVEIRRSAGSWRCIAGSRRRVATWALVRLMRRRRWVTIASWWGVRSAGRWTSTIFRWRGMSTILPPTVSGARKGAGTFPHRRTIRSSRWLLVLEQRTLQDSRLGEIRA